LAGRTPALPASSSMELSKLQRTLRKPASLDGSYFD
jgi:hypothetical protein